MRPLAVAAAILAVTVLAGWHPWFSSTKDWRLSRSVEIVASPIAADALHLHEGRVEFAEAVFAGGLVLRSQDADFGALSALRIDGIGRLMSVSDTGFWFTGHLQRDGDGAPSSIADARIAPLLDEAGQPFSQKWYSDAEGLTFAGPYAYVSTEQKVRLLRYFMDGDVLSNASTELPVTTGLENLPYNSGLEAIATLPDDHPQQGKLLLLVEAPLSGAQNSQALLWRDGQSELLSVRQYDGFSITDADFLSDGDLLLLERKFSPARGAQMRIRRIKGETITPGAVLTGRVVVELDRNHQIDNSEGLSAFMAPDGSLRIGIISDDNHWAMQRTLYLEFILREGSGGSGAAGDETVGEQHRQTDKNLDQKVAGSQRDP